MIKRHGEHWLWTKLRRYGRDASDIVELQANHLFRISLEHWWILLVVLWALHTQRSAPKERCVSKLSLLVSRSPFSRTYFSKDHREQAEWQRFMLSAIFSRDHCSLSMLTIFHGRFLTWGTWHQNFLSACRYVQLAVYSDPLTRYIGSLRLRGMRWSWWKGLMYVLFSKYSIVWVLKISHRST